MSFVETYYEMTFGIPDFCFFFGQNSSNPDAASYVNNGARYGLRTPNEAFFNRNPKLLGLGRLFGQINFGAFGVFSADLSAPILVLRVHVFH